MSGGGKAFVSVVVACRNEIKHIDRFLNSVAAQDVPGALWEIVIADGLSDDGTCEVLERFQRTFPRMRILENPGRIASSGLNRAIRDASGEIIVRMDAHTEYAPDYIRRCLEVLRESKAENVGGPVLTRARGYLAEAIAMAYQSNFACGGSRARDPRFEGYVESVTYGCWRKVTLERVGLFDEQLCRCQDDELNRRITASGGKIYQSPKITSWYWPRATVLALLHQYFQYGFWKACVTRKHRQVRSWRHLVPAASIALLVVLVGGIVALHLSSSRRWESILISAAAFWAVLYSCGSVVASFRTIKPGGWRFLPVLPLIFAICHFSYGAGFLLGIVFNPFDSKGSSMLTKTLTAVTR